MLSLNASSIFRKKIIKSPNGGKHTSKTKLKVDYKLIVPSIIRYFVFDTIQQKYVMLIKSWVTVQTI